MIPHLKDTHSEGVPKDLVSFIVVAVADVCGCYEQLEGIIILDVQSSTLNLLLELPHPLLPVAGGRNHTGVFLGKGLRKACSG